MDTLYKYVQSAHLDSILNHGTFRIGTLYEYRDIEKHGGEIGDAGEGKEITTLDASFGKNFNMRDDGPEAYLFRRMFGEKGKPTPDVNVSMAPGAAIIGSTQCPDMYVYCTSTVFDKDAMEEFGYDACLRIDEPNQFFAALSHAIRRKAEFRLYSIVAYGNREQSHTQMIRVHPALMKEAEHAYQREVRALWKPLKGEPKPFLARCKKAASFCSQVEF